MNFKTQASEFLIKIKNSKRSPAKPSTLASYQSRLNSQILPVLGEKDLSEIENGTLKAFVTEMSNRGLSPASIRALESLVKEVVSSAVDANGNELYPRTWNSEFIDTPVVNPRDQKAPCATRESVQEALGKAKGQDRALIALLAGSGLRVGEALALRVGLDDGRESFWHPESGTVTVRTTTNLNTGKVQNSPKTEAGNRQVDLHPKLNNFLKEVLQTGKTEGIGFVFRNWNGGVARFNTLRKHAITLGIDPRFHCYRRFRVTHLRKSSVPEGLVQYWIGHSGKAITDRYDKIGMDIEARKEWTAKAGLGFQLEA